MPSLQSKTPSQQQIRKTQFLNQFNRLVAAFDVRRAELQPQRAAEYMEALAGIPPDELRDTISHLIKTSEWFPSAAAIRSAWHALIKPNGPTTLEAIKKEESTHQAANEKREAIWRQILAMHPAKYNRLRTKAAAQVPQQATEFLGTKTMDHLINQKMITIYAGSNGDEPGENTGSTNHREAKRQCST